MNLVFDGSEEIGLEEKKIVIVASLTPSSQ
jgi:hypothetical protein